MHRPTPSSPRQSATLCSFSPAVSSAIHASCIGQSQCSACRAPALRRNFRPLSPYSTLAARPGRHRGYYPISLPSRSSGPYCGSLHAGRREYHHDRRQCRRRTVPATSALPGSLSRGHRSRCQYLHRRPNNAASQRSIRRRATTIAGNVSRTLLRRRFRRLRRRCMWLPASPRWVWPSRLTSRKGPTVLRVAANGHPVDIRPAQGLSGRECGWPSIRVTLISPTKTMNRVFKKPRRAAACVKRRRRQRPVVFRAIAFGPPRHSEAIPQGICHRRRRSTSTITAQQYSHPRVAARSSSPGGRRHRRRRFSLR